jgi:hypothetical protein
MHNYLQFQPLLYQVAAGLLAPSSAAFAFRSIFRRRPNVLVKLAEVVAADLATRTVETTDGQRYRGDFLVLAAGSQPNFFGTPGADQHAFPLYSLRDAELLRSRLLAVFESVDRDPSLIAKGALNFVIVGAGPTGTEMAGALGDMLQRLLKDEYKDLDLRNAQVILVDMGGTVLNAFSQKSQAYAARMLRQHGVQVRLGPPSRRSPPATCCSATAPGFLPADCRVADRGTSHRRWAVALRPYGSGPQGGEHLLRTRQEARDHPVAHLRQPHWHGGCGAATALWTAWRGR